MYEPQNEGEVIATKRIWAAKPFLIAYVVTVGFTMSLLINRTPTEEEVVPAMAVESTAQHGSVGGEHEGKEPSLWLQLFRPSRPTARLLLRKGLPILAVIDGSAQEMDNRNLLVYWTGKAGEKPQTLFQVLLPFLRKEPSVATHSVPPIQTPERPSSPTTIKPPQAPSAGPAVVNGGLPLVGVYHTHDWESYISEFPDLTVKTTSDLNKTVSYDWSKKTVVSLGNTLAVRLRDLGVTTVHAPFKHQELGYDFAYKSSRTTVRKILSEAPTVRILIDLHRDGVLDMNTRAMVKGQSVAQIRCIIGQYEQPNWVKNKTFCETLMGRLGQMYPGITLPTRIQNDTYNQDLMPGAVLLEIGGALNTYAEAERSVRLLAEAISTVVRSGQYPR